MWLTILDDAVAEDAETAVFEVRGLKGATGPEGPVRLTIADNEGVPLEGVLRVEGGGDGGPAILWRGRQGGAYCLEASADLQTWIRWPEFPAASGRWEHAVWPGTGEDSAAAYLRLVRTVEAGAAE